MNALSLMQVECVHGSSIFYYFRRRRRENVAKAAEEKAVDGAEEATEEGIFV